MNRRKNGKFVISLDLELNWGVFDVFTIEQYKENLLGAREAVPQLLKLFRKHNIHATWGIVGFLFFDNKKDLLKEVPDELPNYDDTSLSAYQHIEQIGENEIEDPFHFGTQLINQIKQVPNQEIATHTFSHYYCLAKGQCAKQFEVDLIKAIEVAKKHNISIKTIIFPRNQINPDYLSICKSHGVKLYRGCEKHWLYKVTGKQDSKFKRVIRLMDSYMNLSGHHVYVLDDLVQKDGIIDIPSSQFLRPYVKRMSVMESLKLRRIKAGMEMAAKERKLYHLWWHPHNFGADLKESMNMLGEIITYYQRLNEQYGMESVSMGELANTLLKKSYKVKHDEDSNENRGVSHAINQMA
ncbi:polysaccharide deacetylase family protein [Paucisalibacillus sp. EB02]|uniref:polysaccharide deacetylase family protein n=1 Tax=Paucisalibacillus sp. EB02 TaxID=1347087 RepID=UPI0005A93FE2|nr:polysaccharide deacetylase family protein [Paucisalibacillus sp. EB02]